MLAGRIPCQYCAALNKHHDFCTWMLIAFSGSAWKIFLNSRASTPNRRLVICSERRTLTTAVPSSISTTSCCRQVVRVRRELYGQQGTGAADDKEAMAHFVPRRRPARYHGSSKSKVILVNGTLVSDTTVGQAKVGRRRRSHHLDRHAALAMLLREPVNTSHPSMR